MGGGFRTAIEKELRKKHLAKVGEKLNKAFTRKQDSKTMYRYVPRHIYLTTLQAQKNMTEKDVIDAVEYNPPFRLRDLASAATQGTHAAGQLVVEMFPHNTDYGAMIDRGSNITIACPSSVSDAGIGNMGYFLALIGGFNFISKEIEADIHEPVSYYLIDDENSPKDRKKYLDDLKKLAGGKENWTIFLISSERQSDYSLHFITRANKKTERETTVLEKDKFTQLFTEVSESLDKDFEIKSELDTEYKAAGINNASVRIGGGITTNAFTIRVSSELAVWDPRYIAVCKDLAKAINDVIGDPYKMTPDNILKEKGMGYIM